MKVDVTLKDLTNVQVAAVLLLLPASNTNPVSWKVSNWVYNNQGANLELNGITDDVLQAIFYELRERAVVLVTSSRSGR